MRQSVSQHLRKMNFLSHRYLSNNRFFEPIPFDIHQYTCGHTSIAKSKIFGCPRLKARPWRFEVDK
jgi:hypothetical protein